MSARQRQARRIDDASDHEAVTIAVDPRYTARHKVMPSTDDNPNNPSLRTSPPPGFDRYPLSIHFDPVAHDHARREAADAPTDDRLERAARRLGAYWGRALVLAVRTVFADIKRRWSHRRSSPKTTEVNR
jgi:hypothetical protein